MEGGSGQPSITQSVLASLNVIEPANYNRQDLSVKLVCSN